FREGSDNTPFVTEPWFHRGSEAQYCQIALCVGTGVMPGQLAPGLLAAFPVPGPQDVVGDSGAGVLSDDLRAAIKAALSVPAAKAREHALRFSWKRSAEQFIENLRPLCQPKDNLWCHGENVNSTDSF